MKIELIGKVEESKDIEGLMRYCEELSKRFYLNYHYYDDLLVMEACPLGQLVFSHEDLYFTISANNDFAGPGFHHLVIRFFDAFMMQHGFEASVNDPSGYNIHHNFDILVNQVYIPWIKRLSDGILEMKDYQMLNIGFSNVAYLPMEQDGMVATYLGRKPIDYFKQDPKVIAQDLFIWPNKDKDALYYENCAKYILAMDCFYEYSIMNEEAGEHALALMEASYKLDPNIAFPLDIYDELCEILKHPKGLEKAIHDEDFVKGYRSELVYYPIKSFYIPIDGCCECNYSDVYKSYYFSGPYQQLDDEWEYAIQIFENANVDDLKQFDSSKVIKLDDGETMICMERIYSGTYDINALVKHGKHHLLIRINASDESIADKLEKQLLKIKYFDIINEQLN